MKVCQNCGANQIQRTADGRWRVVCKCRRCGFVLYDSRTIDEIKNREMVDQLCKTLWIWQPQIYT